MNQLRIISGKYGGRLISSPKNRATHPMGDREKQAIFNRIRHHLSEVKVLDAFAGSGALGIEALSEGAEFAVFLEKDRKALLTIAANLQKLNLPAESARIVIGLRQAASFAPYDLIFADPPYDRPQYDKISELAKMLSSGGILVLSHPISSPPPSFPRLCLLSDSKYAAACIKIYQSLE